jgi:predicted kinase
MTKNNLILMSGLPGSGKSTLAEAVARKLRLPLFSVDPIESAIIKSGLNKSFETGLAAYLVAEALATEQFKLGSSVVIDAVTAEEEAKGVWRELAKKQNSTLIIIECATSDTVLHKKRIEERVRNLHGMPEVTWGRVEERRKAYTPWREQTLKIDTANELESNAEEVVQYIQSTRKERTIIVNDQDQIIGHKEPGTLLKEDIYRVSSLWVTNSKGDILLAQRKFTQKLDPGKWGPAVAGTVDEGETYESNIIKEAEEEIGLKDMRPALGPKTKG